MATATGTVTGTGEPLTHRRDPWWAQPLVTFTALTAFVIYATFRVFENAYFEVDNGTYHYLSPFGSPDLTGFVPAFLLGIPLVGQFFAYPAFLILPFPAGFRFTCYYYRKAYYRSFAARPAACAVPALKGFGYKGERGLLVIQNLHRYFLYFAILIIFILAYDALLSIFTPNGLYFGIGSAILLLNVLFLAGYTFGCHSFRHLIGGKLDCFSCDGMARGRYKLWEKVTVLNGRHMMWAWLSLVSVALSDIWIRYVATSGATTFLGVPV